MNIHLKMATVLTHLMDNQFRVGKFRFGLDPILGVIPGFGDIFTLILSSYILLIAFMLRLPSGKIAIMLRHIMTDFIIGLVPIVGDLADLGYKANSKNLRIIHEHLGIKIVEDEIVETL